MGGWNWIDKTDMRWGKLVAKKYLGEGKWLCHCDCGNDSIVKSDNLKIDKSKRSTMSCGRCTGINKDIHFFEKIDSEEKAYFLGFLAADGTISDNGEQGTYSIKLVVSFKDIDILEKMKKAFNSEAKIHIVNIETNLPQGGKCKSTTSSLLICNKKLVRDIEKYGITPRKSLTLNVNTDLIPKELQRHFIRGLIDGDGSFGLYDRKTKTEKIKWSYTVGLISSRLMVEKVKKLVLEVFPEFKIDIWQAKGCKENTCRWGLSRKDDFKKFLDYIYKDSNIYLDRKYEKYIECMKKFETIKTRKIPYTNFK